MFAKIYKVKGILSN